MTRFSPSTLVFLCWPSLKPSPMATMRTIEATPQAMPAMVRKLRSLFRARLEATCLKMSISGLRQDHLLSFVQTPQDLRLRSVADTGHNRHPAAPFVVGRIGDFDFGGFVLFIKNRALRHSQHALLFFENKFRIGGHLGA